MDLLAGYDSSSSSSLSLTEAQHRTAPSITRNHDAILPRGAQNALHVRAPHHSPGAGYGGHRSSRPAVDDVRVGNCGGGDGGQNGGMRAHAGRNEDGFVARKRQTSGEMDAGVKADGEMFMSHIEKNKKAQTKNSTVIKGHKYGANATIAGYDRVPYGASDNDNVEPNSNQHEFERSHPHWEGRWAGHIHMPLPQLESLDFMGIDVVSTNNNHVGIEKESRSNEPSQNSDFDCQEKSDESSSSDESGSSSEDEEDNLPQSRLFLPTARNLIHHWARLLQYGTNDATTDCDAEDAAKEDLIIVPHIPMHPIETKTNSLTPRPPVEQLLPIKSLHISLVRPIYLPAPSVDPFLADIEKSINAIISFDKGKMNTNQHGGRTLRLLPHNTTIFTNDQQTRSFLAIPVSKESSRWVKQSLLPPIDAAMMRFGLETYYSTEEEGCILHVSVASVKGNVIPRMIRRGGQGTKKSCVESNDAGSKVRSISLFSDHHVRNQQVVLESITRCIPIRVNRIECEFGSAKQLAIPF